MAEKSKKALVDKIVKYEGTDGKMHKGKEINYRTMMDGKAHDKRYVIHLIKSLVTESGK
jgi:2-methylaconitate cis-trans-isomerase PrpF